MKQRKLYLAVLFSFFFVTIKAYSSPLPAKFHIKSAGKLMSIYKYSTRLSKKILDKPKRYVPETFSPAPEGYDYFQISSITHDEVADFAKITMMIDAIQALTEGGQALGAINTKFEDSNDFDDIGAFIGKIIGAAIVPTLVMIREGRGTLKGPAFPLVTGVALANIINEPEINNKLYNILLATFCGYTIYTNPPKSFAMLTAIIGIPKLFGMALHVVQAMVEKLNNVYFEFENSIVLQLPNLIFRGVIPAVMSVFLGKEKIVLHLNRGLIHITSMIIESAKIVAVGITVVITMTIGLSIGMFGAGFGAVAGIIGMVAGSMTLIVSGILAVAIGVGGLVIIVGGVAGVVSILDEMMLYGYDGKGSQH